MRESSAETGIRMNDDFSQMKWDREFEQFYKANLVKVIHHVHHRMSDCEAAKNIAEDVAQEVFYLALKKWDEVKVSDQPLRWLFQTANYKILEASRKHFNHPTEYLEDYPQEPPADVPEYGMSELEISALKAVGENAWNLVKKYYFQGYPIEELAEAEGVTPNNMRVRLMRVRNKLKDALRDDNK